MATEKEANKARELHQDLLASKGIHSIGVDVIGKKGSKKFGVIAFLEKKIEDLPTKLTIPKGKKKINVPLVIELSEKFKVE